MKTAGLSLLPTRLTIFYNYYEGGLILQAFLNNAPEVADAYFSSGLVDISACLLPEELPSAYDSVTISFSKESNSIETTYQWNDISADIVNTINTYYKNLLFDHEWFDSSQSDSAVSVYARLDLYRAIHYHSRSQDDLMFHDILITISNFTVEKGE